MSEVKKHLTYEEQIEKLRSRGCLINDDVACKNTLKNIGYYRLSAYFLPFKRDDDNYTEELSFERVYHIYEFDRKLRNLLFAAIEVIEVSLRARIAYFHSEKYGPLGYLNPATFNNKHKPEKFKENIDREIENNKKVLFVKHHIDNYGGQFPLWVICELFTFGMISYFYNDLTTADKKQFAGSDYKDMVSWLRCCTDIRNICAHYGRLYYRSFSAMPTGFNIPEATKRRLWGAMLSVKALYPSTDKWNTEFMPAIEALFEEYKEDINLYHLAFPKNWTQQLKK
jgi:abortive infection bacteriophage resistance protein